MEGSGGEEQNSEYCTRNENGKLEQSRRKADDVSYTKCFNLCCSSEMDKRSSNYFTQLLRRESRKGYNTVVQQEAVLHRALVCRKGAV